MGCNYLSLPLIPAFDTAPLRYRTQAWRVNHTLNHLALSHIQLIVLMGITSFSINNFSQKQNGLSQRTQMVCQIGRPIVVCLSSVASFTNRDDFYIFYPRPFWPTGIVIACVCVCVCVSVCLSTFACPSDNSSHVPPTITWFGQKDAKHFA